MSARRGWRWYLSRVIPTRFRSTYWCSLHGPGVDSMQRERATWWQWRGRIWAHRVVTLTLAALALVVLAAVPAFAQSTSSPSAPSSTGTAITAAVALAIFGAFVFAIIGFAKALRNREWNAVVTTLAWWVGGFVALLIFSTSDFADHVRVLGVLIGSASIADLLVLGIAGPGSWGIAFNQYLKARDGTQSAAQSPLLHTRDAIGANVPAAGGAGSDVELAAALATAGEPPAKKAAARKRTRA